MALPYLYLAETSSDNETLIQEWITSNGLLGEKFVKDLIPKIEALLQTEHQTGRIESLNGVAFEMTQQDGAPLLYFDVAQSNLALYKSVEELEALKVYTRALNHDIATPLQSIALQAELLSIKGCENPELFNKSVNSIKESIFASQNIVEDLSSFSKLTLTTNEVSNVLEVIMHVKKILADQIKEKHAVIAFGAFSNLQIQPFRLLIILKNIIQNSLKYAGELNPQILLYETKGKQHYTISIRDNGIGIPLEDQEDIFYPFNRASNVGKVAGTGVGLNTCKSLMEGANGEIKINSPLNQLEKNKGTAIHLVFPNSMVIE